MKPRQWETTTNTTSNDYTVTSTTTTRVDKLKDSTLRIPVSARVHPEGQRQLVRLSAQHKVAHASSVMNILTTLLQSSTQKNTVKVSCEELVSLSGLSTSTVLNCLSFLTKYEFIYKATKQTYRLSPRIVWYGNQIDWAIELAKLDKRDQLEETSLTKGTNNDTN